MSYATLAQLKAELGVTDTSQDGYLQDLLDRVSAWIDTYCGRTFSNDPLEVTDEAHNRAGSVIWLHRTGVKSITAVSYKDRHTDGWTSLAAADYEWTSEGRLDLGICHEYVKVSYTYGGDGVPKEIEGACIALASRLHRTRSTRREQIGDYEIEYDISKLDSAADESAYKVLDAYRVRHV